MYRKNSILPMGRPFGSNWSRTRNTEQLDLSDTEGEEDEKDPLDQAMDILIQTFAQEMLETAKSTGAFDSLHHSIKSEDSFLNEATVFCKSDPQFGYLFERLSLHFGNEESFGLTGDYLHFVTDLKKELSQISIEDIPLRLARIKQAIEQDSTLGLRDELQYLPSVFSYRAAVLGEEIEALQFYIAWGVPLDSFTKEADKQENERRNLEHRGILKTYQARAVEMLDELVQIYRGNERAEKAIEQASVWAEKELQTNKEKSVAGETVETLMLEFLFSNKNMLLSLLPAPEDPSKKKFTLQDQLVFIRKQGYQLHLLPQKIREEFLLTEQSKALYALLWPYSCFIGKVRYIKDSLGNVSFDANNSLGAGAWPVVSPKSVDVYHESFAMAFASCQAVRRQFKRDHADIIPADPPLRHQEKLVEDLLLAANARQTVRRIASDRNLELSDKIDVELSDNEWLERLGGLVSPFPWQLAATEVAANNPRVFLADPTGFGKTGQALLILERNLAFPAVIVCPPAVFQNWAAAALQWLPHRTVSLIEAKMPEQVDVGGQMITASDVWQAHDQGMIAKRGVPAEIMPKFATVSVEKRSVGSGREFEQKQVPIDRFDVDIIIVSKDSAKVDIKHGIDGKLIPRILKRNNAGFVFDESHYLKNRRTATYQAAKVIASQARTRLLLSATVLTNNALELRNQLEILGQLYDFFGSPQEFYTAFESLKGGGIRGGADSGLAEKSISQSEKVNEILRRCCYVRRFPEQLQAMGAMPAPTRITLPIFLDKKWTDSYSETIVGFERAIHRYATDIAKIILHALIHAGDLLLEKIQSFEFLQLLQDAYKRKIEYATGKGKTTKSYKGKSDAEVKAIAYQSTIEDAILYLFSSITNETVEKIDREATRVTEILNRAIAENNAEFEEILRAEQSPDEEDEEDEEAKAKKTKKQKEKEKQRAEEQSNNLTNSQVKLFQTCLMLFLRLGRDRKLADASGSYVKADKDEIDFDGSASALIDAFAKQIAKSRMSGAVLNRILKLSQITSAAKAPYAAALILKMLGGSSLAPLVYHDEETKRKAIERSIYPMFEEGGKIFEQRPTKVVFFSLFTSTLEYVERIIKEKGFDCVRITGKDSKKAKAAAQVAFASNPDIRVCLCSIGAAREGLNLQVADQALFSDVSYTAASTEQAEGRIKRLGSPFPRVFLTYLNVPDSIDTLKTALMERKRELMLGTQEGARIVKRRFTTYLDGFKQTKFAIRYEMEIDGGRVEPLFLGMENPAKAAYLIKDSSIADEFTLGNLPLTEIGSAALDAWRQTGDEAPVIDTLTRWDSFTKVLLESIKQVQQANAESAAIYGEDSKKARISAKNLLEGISAVDEEDEEEEESSEDALINTILSVLDSLPALQLSEGEQAALFASISSLGNLGAICLDAELKRKVTT